MRQVLSDHAIQSWKILRKVIKTEKIPGMVLMSFEKDSSTQHGGDLGLTRYDLNVSVDSLSRPYRVEIF